MRDADQKSAFDRDGFLIVREFLRPDELEELRDELRRYINDVVPGLPGTAAFYDDPARPETLKQLQHMGSDPFFENYRRHEKWKSLADLLIGEPAGAQEPEWFNKPPMSDHTTPPHQDNYYFCLRPCHVITMWLAMTPIDEENGCLRYVAGSHLGGVRPHAATEVLGFSQGITDFGPGDEVREHAVRLQPGDLAVHHGETIHRAMPNRSANRRREAFAMVFRGESCRRDESAFERYQSAVRQQHASLSAK